MKSRVVIVAVVIAMLAGACGERSNSTGEEDTVGAPGPAPAASDPGMFGTMESPCGPGTAKGSTDVGVTDESITVTGYSDSGGPVAGLNSGVDDAAAAFVKWCNGHGGINGRQIKLEFRNANLFDYGTVVSQACGDSLALVGGFAVFDDAGAQAQVDCGLVAVPANGVSSIQAGADLTYFPLPSPPNAVSVAMETWLMGKYPDSVKAAGYIQPDVASIDYIVTRQQEALTKIGYQFIYDGRAAVTETNWPSFAIAMKDAGVKYLAAASTYEEFVGLQKAMAQQDWSPEVTGLPGSFFVPNYLTEADGVAEGSYMALTTWPLTEAAENPAVRDFLTALQAAVPDAKPQQLGITSFSAWLLWATAVKSLGSKVTRQNLDEALAKIHEWDAGGLQPTSDPGSNTPAPCVIVMQVVEGQFVRAFPTKEGDPAVYDSNGGFACDSDYIVKLDTDYDNGAKAAG